MNEFGLEARKRITVPSETGQGIALALEHRGSLTSCGGGCFIGFQAAGRGRSSPGSGTGMLLTTPDDSARCRVSAHSPTDAAILD